MSHPTESSPAQVENTARSRKDLTVSSSPPSTKGSERPSPPSSVQGTPGAASNSPVDPRNSFRPPTLKEIHYRLDGIRAHVAAVAPENFFEKLVLDERADSLSLLLQFEREVGRLGVRMAASVWANFERRIRSAFLVENPSTSEQLTALLWARILSISLSVDDFSTARPWCTLESTINLIAILNQTRSHLKWGSTNGDLNTSSSSTSMGDRDGRCVVFLAWGLDLAINMIQMLHPSSKQTLELYNSIDTGLVVLFHIELLERNTFENCHLTQNQASNCKVNMESDPIVDIAFASAGSVFGKDKAYLESLLLAKNYLLSQTESRACGYPAIGLADPWARLQAAKQKSVSDCFQD